MYLRANINSQVVKSTGKQGVSGDIDRARLQALATRLNVNATSLAHLTDDDVSAQLVALHKASVPVDELGSYDYSKRPKRRASTKTKSARNSTTKQRPNRKR